MTEHLYKRMPRRDFTEIDLRRMMEHATGYRPDVVEGRWIIKTRVGRQRWEIIVEPIHGKKLLTVVTAYDVWD